MFYLNRMTIGGYMDITSFAIASSLGILFDSLSPSLMHMDNSNSILKNDKDL